MYFSLIHEAIRAIDETSLDSNLGEFFDEKLTVETSPAVSLKIVEEKCSEIIHCSDFGS